MRVSLREFYAGRAFILEPLKHGYFFYFYLYECQRNALRRFAAPQSVQMLHCPNSEFVALYCVVIRQCDDLRLAFYEVKPQLAP